MSSKITQLAPLATPADGDVIPVVDTSDTTMAASGTTKKVSVADLTQAITPVTSVNGHAGDVVLSAADVNADMAGAAASEMARAQAAEADETARAQAAEAAEMARAQAAEADETARAQAAEALALPKAGGTMSGPIAMGSSKVTGLAAGSASGDAVAFQQLPSGSSPLGIGSGGTGSATKNFADLSTNQTVGGIKTFSGEVIVPAPSAAGDAVTKAYADSISTGLSIQAAAAAATVGTESYTYTISAGTVTGISGVVIDGQTVTAGQYILVKDAPAVSGNTGIAGSSEPGNGLYHVDTASGNLAVSRASGMSGANTPVAAFVFVVAGTHNAGAGYVVTTPLPGAWTSYGSGNIQWTQFSQAGQVSADGTSLDQSGSVISLHTPVTIARGGTGSGSQQAAMNALAGAVTSGDYLRGNGTNVTMSALAAADLTGTVPAAALPAASTSNPGAIELGGGTANFLRADGSWIAPPGTGAIHNMPVLNVVADYGANNSGGADTQPAIASAIADAITAGGAIIYFPAGTYRVNSTITCHTAVPIYFQGAGRWLTRLMYYSTTGGDCLRIYDSSTYSTRTQYGGGVTALTIDGTNASASGSGACGLHMGDNFNYNVDISVQNFYGTGGIGVHFDNQSYWTEQLYGRLYTQNCRTAVVFDVSGATTSTGSYARIDMVININQVGPSFDGVVLQNGAFMYDGNLSIRGNFGSSTTAVSSAVLRLTGTTPAGHPGAGGYSLMFSMHLDIMVECDAVRAFRSQTIVENVPGGNFIRGCTGVLDFAGGGVNFAQSNLLTGGGTLSPGAIWFHGPVYGDASLNPAVLASPTSTPIMTLGPTLHSRGAASYSGATLNIYTHEGDYFLPPALTQNTTIVLNPGGQATLGVPQSITIVLTEAASGTLWGVTWPASGSPTTTTPKVIWPGGTAPSMTRVAGAVDVYHLETINGATWYGSANQGYTP